MVTQQERTMTQTQQVLDYLNKHGSITPGVK